MSKQFEPLPHITIQTKDIPRGAAMRLGQAAYNATLNWLLESEELLEKTNKKNPAPLGTGFFASAPEDAPEHSTNEDK